ncbi:hypothetical protein [Streptomyces seoulensis]|uniref:hypothetical protein n=1 Tax=Streptomyces seoulensis TaxID=73044 RepID=UPI003C2C997B
MSDEEKLIDPSGIPHFIGDLGTLDTDVMLLTADAGQFRASGSDVHTEFQGLSAFYEAPEAEQLFATTLPVKQKSDAFADDLEKVATALSDYSFEVQPLARKLDTLKADATAFVNSVAGDDDWRKDQDKVDHNNDLWHDVNRTVAAFQDAERTAYNKIMALIGGTRMGVDDGSGGKNKYGYRAEDLDHAEATPWGAPAEREYEGWAWLAHQGKQVWDGVWQDGVIGTIHGVGTLFGSDGWDAAGEAWKNLAKLSTASALTSVTMGTWWLLPEDKQPSWLRDSRKAYKETAKGFIAYDQWKTNPARAAGAVGFNVLTIVGTEGAGSAVSGAGKAGAAARTLSLAGKVGRAIDPMTYAGKAAKFAFVRVGDTFSTLKNLRTGAYADMADLGGRYAPAEHPVGVGERPVSVPQSAVEYVDAKGHVVYLTEDGHVLGADGRLRQHLSDAEVELAANDRAGRIAVPHPALAAAHGPEPVAASHGGDGVSEVGGHTHDHHAAHRSVEDASRDPHHGTGHTGGESGTDFGHRGGGGSDASSAGAHADVGHDGWGPTTERPMPSANGPDLGGAPRGNLPDGSWAGEGGLRLSPHDNAAVHEFLRTSTDAEPRITDTLQRTTGDVGQGRLIGLEYRLKGEESLKRKLATALLERPNATAEGLLHGIKDSVRYTIEFPASNYSQGVQRAVDSLRSQGFENVTFKDTWSSPGYKGINSTWKDPVSGQVFEVQFHTPESFAAKMDGHLLYEKERLPGVSANELDAIRTEQRELFGKVPVPHGVSSIDLEHELTTAHPATHAPDVAPGHASDPSVHGNGPPVELTPAERAFHDMRLHELSTRYSDDFDQLKQDPDHKGAVKPSEMDEARVALDLRDSGKIPADIQRPPGPDLGDLYSPGSGTFYDIKGVHSDWPPLNNVRDKSMPFKGAYDPANNARWIKKLDEQITDKRRVVILDMRNANQAAIDDLKAIVEEHGWSDRVVWYP